MIKISASALPTPKINGWLKNASETEGKEEKAFLALPGEMFLLPLSLFLRPATSVSQTTFQFGDREKKPTRFSRRPQSGNFFAIPPRGKKRDNEDSGAIPRPRGLHGGNIYEGGGGVPLGPAGRLN